MSEEPRTEVLRRDGITTAEPSFALQSKSSCSFARLLKKGLQLALVELLCQPTADGVLADHSPSRPGALSKGDATSNHQPGAVARSRLLGRPLQFLETPPPYTFADPGE